MSERIEVYIETGSPAISNGRTIEAFGVQWVDDRFESILKAGVTVPSSATKTFSTAIDNQTSITLNLYRGANSFTRHCHFLGSLDIGGIFPSGQGSPKIQVAFVARTKDLVLSVSGEPGLIVEFTPPTHHDEQRASIPPTRRSEPTAAPNIIEVRRVLCPTCGRKVKLTYDSAKLTDRYCQYCAMPLFAQGDIKASTTKQSTPKVDEDALSNALNDLNCLVGLARVKAEVTQLVDLISVQNRRRSLGRRIPDFSNHIVFSGNPGTGKTTVARLIGRIYCALGVCRTSKVVETDRSGLVAEYVGQTAIKTKDKISSALGGILFIDEAYSLTPNTDHGGDFGQEAIDVLLKEMEDHRNDLIVIVAGYPDEMARFISSNPGLHSRFSQHVTFDDYSAEEMTQIFCDLCANNEYFIQSGASGVIREYFDKLVEFRPTGFANGRTVRNLFEKVLRNHSTRIRGLPDSTDETELDLITIEDVKNR